MKPSHNGLSENASYKIVALLITIILWVIILGSKEASLIKMIPTTYILPHDMIITNLIPNEVAFRLTGPRLPLKRFSEIVEPLSIDLTSAIEGTTTIRIHPDSIDVPPGIRVVSVAPATIATKLERVVSVDLPIEVTFKGNVSRGHKLGKITVEPSHFVVNLVRSSVEKVKKITTDPIDLDSETTTFSSSVKLAIDGIEVLKKDIRPEVRVSVEVK